MATTSISEGPTSNALDGKLNFEQDRNRIIGRDANNNPRLLILAEEDNFIIKISQRDIDVLTAPNDLLVFNSNNNLFKIVKTGTFVMPSIPGTAGSFAQHTEAVATGVISDKPLAGFMFASSSGGYEPFPLVEWILDTGAMPVSGGIFYRYKAYTDLIGNEVYVIVHGVNFDTAAISSFTVRYYIVQETAG